MELVLYTFLTTDFEGNESDWARSISYKLYDGNEKIRIAQETVLGVAGVRILQQVGYNFDVVHMNMKGQMLFLLHLNF